MEQSDNPVYDNHIRSNSEPTDDVMEPNVAPDHNNSSVWDRVTEVSSIAPVHGDPSLEPADNPWELAMMAGWGDPEGLDRGHDAMMDVDLLVTGEVDAMEELRIDSATPGGVLSLGPNEQLSFRQTDNSNSANLFDWTTHL